MVEWLNEYFSGNRPQIDFSLKPEGTDFCVAKATRNRIWTIKTYGDLANLVGEERNKPNMSASNRWCSR